MGEHSAAPGRYRPPVGVAGPGRTVASREPADEQTRRAHRLRIDPTACDGVGICAHLATELIRADMWGYPIIATEPVDERTVRQARAAVRACPHRALFLD